MRILILGAGAYGLALSTILADKNEISVYSSIEEEINFLRTNKKYLDVELPSNINYVNSIDNYYDLIVVALPTNVIEVELKRLRGFDIPVVIASKGLCGDKFISDVVSDLGISNICVLSGPSFARDTILKKPIILTLAGSSNLKDIFNSRYVKIEETDDIVGVQLCGVLKNIFAIGAGILEGMGASCSTKAAFLTNVINETKRMIEKMGGNKDTVLLSCGVGDIILTCTSDSSRNFTLGLMIGRGDSKDKIDDYLSKNTVEGLVALETAKKFFSFKIIDIMYDILFNGRSVESLFDYIVDR